MSAERFRRALLDAGLLADAGLPGVYHRSFEFERIAQGVAAYVSAAGSGEQMRRLHLGPVQARTTLEKSGYVTSFPNLVGVVESFPGSASDVPGFLEAVEGGADWTESLAPTDVALCSAGCHPIYPLVSGSTLPSDGERVEVETWCFRREPSPDPARMQSFRQHEFVYLGTPEGAVAHRDRWLAQGRELLCSLGLDVSAVVANDPFFGRTGRLLAASQRTKELKYELVAPISADVPGAISSANYHEGHFGEAFDIRLADGAAAHTACIGFGLERITLSLLRRHGLHQDEWPAEVRQRLALTTPAVVG
ncbi:MAG TPA: amino acid--[acyl-carrier-protein] ligase [Acidimicrobiales bacterium]|jgi:seryl-tRNA synthetase|nr:amino acid--[acyl-carrier-protein] ligase [Acidimicrobiales bacterium]